MNPAIDRIRALQGDTRRRAKMHRPKAPRLPAGAEVAYVRAARGLVRAMHEATLAELAPVFAELEGARRDDLRDLVVIALDRVKQRIGEVLADAAIGAIAAGIFDRVNRHNRTETERVLGISGPLLDPDLRPELDAFRRANVDLIRSIGPECLADVVGLVQQAQITGRRVEDLRADIAERYGVSQSRAELIARDQVLKANADLTRIRQRRLGITSYRWSTSDDSRVREGHRALQGQAFRWDTPPVVDPATGRRAHPGVDFQCRCVAIAILPGEEEG